MQVINAAPPSLRCTSSAAGMTGPLSCITHHPAIMCLRPASAAGVSDALAAATRHLESLGAAVDEVSLPSFAVGLPAYYVIALSEASSNLSRYDGVRYGHRAEADGELAASGADLAARCNTCWATQVKSPCTPGLALAKGAVAGVMDESPPFPRCAELREMYGKTRHAGLGSEASHGGGGVNYGAP